MAQSSRPREIEILKDRLDLALADKHDASDFRSSALVALAFCDLLSESMNTHQREAVEVARQFLAGSDSGAHRACVVEFAKIVDGDRISDADSRTSAINRLVWAALNINTKFSGYAAEFLVELGETAELDAQQMGAVFAKYVPNF